jgi:hypothetical protein
MCFQELTAILFSSKKWVSNTALLVYLPNRSSLITFPFWSFSTHLNLATSAIYIDSIGRWFIRSAFHLPYTARMCPGPGAARGNKWIVLWCYKDTKLIKICSCIELDVEVEWLQLLKVFSVTDDPHWYSHFKCR